MPQNLEIKARIDNPALIQQRAEKLGATLERKISQLDTYFHVNQGRLKLREIDAKNAELIFYQREESNSQRWSKYEIFPLKDSKPLKEILTKSLGVKAVVQKSRTIYLYQNARIHIDLVTNLGSFLEVEVVVDQDKQQAKELMTNLLQTFGIKEEQLKKHSYSDLVTRGA